MLNLSVILEDSAREHPDRTAIVSGDARMSYALVNTLANQVANLLASRGVGPGDTVALACPNLPYFPVVYYGVLKAGAAVVPLNVLLQPREIAYHLRDSGAKALFCFEGTPDLPLGERGLAAYREAVPDGPHADGFFLLPATPLAVESGIDGVQTLWAALRGRSETFETTATAPDDTAVILYTSGTTGQPKGAELSHQNMLMNAIVSDEMFERTGEDVLLATLPLFHSFGQTVIMNVGFRRRASLVLMPRFDPAGALALMREERVTFFAGVPTMYWAMLTAVRAGGGAAPATLRTAVAGGSSLPVEVLKDFEKTFGVPVLEGYGLSETSPVASFNQRDRPTKPGSVGTPVWGVEMRLIDAGWDTVEGEGPGEIAVRGHNVMKGYYGRPEATAEVTKDGWFRTGDIATRDADGFYFIVDRAKDMIIRGGFNVYPRELEEVLMTHEAVSLAAVVGVPHESLGEEVKAHVILKPGAAVTEEELVEWCKATMAAYKYPRLVEFRESFPMTASGKILKRELR
ncbi:long-chain-fatty-acid--CoA ligase [Sphaerisporangium krabiense]|uniref:Long-chain acyl-CoA synthetase n=1 Tax=Sphaerisporangium krabiense TaxID=763782 RepID=A0A7W8Z9X8_9ACTN|nr:long-chain fatty acid--CoA ligase [Sphaerisporangium krabiense]MBB5630041.1 long-chain acyl-CoA synthetase [Sphaerisporangium krabiense]GII64988.1 long-chain-fatty-acid--CoA ligase [Sphaerisporangium krabiense]